jgi:transglutaminase-like putative cysteine protease
MNGLSADARRDLPLAVVAAATTWVTMLSWRGFSSQWGEYLGPLLLLAAVVAVGGVLFRAAPLPRRVSLLLHILVIALLTWLMMGGSLLHPVGGAHHVANGLNDAWISSETYLPPVPASVPGIAPMMIPFGALSLLVVDVLACWLRRVSLAGLPLLAIYCVPISLLGRGVSWVVFLVAAVGFLLMMYLQESAHITRWGRPLGSTAASVDPSGFGVSTGASKTTAGAVGGVAVVLAVILPVFIPTLHLDGLGLFGAGSGGGDGVKVVNPITDMNRDLQRGKNVPLLDITTDDPDPSYLRIAVLAQFNGVEWSTGDRKIISDQTASGLVPLEDGLSRSVPLDSFNYKVTATNDFQSTWLPTQFPVSDIAADGSWHYDIPTMDFIAGNNTTTTAGLSYTMTTAKPEIHAFDMVHSLTAPLAIQTTYTALPPSLPSTVGDLAQKVTDGAKSRYEQAVMLQNWFRETGGFRYSLKTQSVGSGNPALLHFLFKGPGGRVGYCEQFATAYAVMARTLQIPARVAVGFLQPHQGAKAGEWVYKAHDLHAWPELYFQGSGWVRFEPTPGTRAATTPSYTHEAVRKAIDPKSNQTQGGKLNTDSASPTTQQPRNQTSSKSSSSGTGIPWTWTLLGLGVLVLVVAMAMVPRAVRRSRRTRRLAGGAEDAWTELRDSAIDLGVSWPAGRSPHETGHHLAAWFGPEPDGAPPMRPPRGRGLSPGAEDALDRIVLTLERVRYARDPHDVPGALAEDVETCIAALEHGSMRSALRRATWLPRSLYGGRRRAAARAARDAAPEAVTPGGVIDHVG